MSERKIKDVTLEKIREYIGKHDYKKALDLASNPKYYENEAIQLERVYLLVKYFDNYQDAYKVWKHFEKSKNPKMITKGVVILTELGYIEQALFLANRDNLKDVKLKRAEVNALKKAKRYDEALLICDNPLYKDDIGIRKLKQEIMGICIDEKDEISITLTEVYADAITLEELKNKNIDGFKKNILLIAYYEKHNQQVGLNFIKQLKKEEQEPANIKTLNILEQRFKSKKNNYFDVNVYGNVLQRRVDLTLASTLEKKEETGVIVHKEKEYVIPKKEEKKEKKEKKILEISGNRVNNRYNTINDKPTPINVINNKVLIKDVFGYEIIEIQKYLYVRMQLADTRVKAIRAWDNLEVLANRDINDKASLEKIIKLLKVISTNKFLDIEYNENKVKKYYK